MTISPPSLGGGGHSNQEQIIGPGLACALISLDKRNPWQYSSFSQRVSSSPLASSREDLRRSGGASATRTWTWTSGGGWTRDKWSKIAQFLTVLLFLALFDQLFNLLVARFGADKWSRGEKEKDTKHQKLLYGKNKSCRQSTLKCFMSNYLKYNYTTGSQLTVFKLLNVCLMFLLNLCGHISP